VQVGAEGVSYLKVELPQQRRDTRIEKDMSVDDVAREIVEWLRS
jgi:electron transfer flavoprotein beta subunit